MCQVVQCKVKPCGADVVFCVEGCIKSTEANDETGNSTMARCIMDRITVTSYQNCYHTWSAIHVVYRTPHFHLLPMFTLLHTCLLLLLL